MQTLVLTPSDSNYRFITTLENLPFGFDIRWNSRDESFYMDVLRDDGSVVRAGIRLVLGPALGGRVADADFPPGAFFAVDLTNSAVEATYDDIGKRVAIVYLSAADIADVLA